MLKTGAVLRQLPARARHDASPTRGYDRTATSGTARIKKHLPEILVVAAVVFNGALAFVNGNLLGLSPLHVMAVEGLIVGVAHLYALNNYRRSMAPWYGLIFFFVIFGLLRSMATGEINPKLLRDVLIIPTFVVLGMTVAVARLPALIVASQAVVTFFLVIEGAATAVFSKIFHVMDYYIATRGNVAQDFWNQESDLYVSATRPDDRLFSFIDLHRMSSIFLEPVSLGNWCVIITALICAFYDRFTKRQRQFLIGSNLLVLLGSDGRLALMSSLLIVAAAYVARRSRNLPVFLYLPAAVAVAFVVVYAGGYKGGEDNFPSRVAYTVELLSSFDLRDLMGMSDRYLSRAVDSGVSYLIITQSLLGLACLWATIVFSASTRTAEQRIFLHAVAIYLSCNVIVSFAFLTIKTGALLWFVYGALQGGALETAAVRPPGALPGHSRQRPA